MAGSKGRLLGDLIDMAAGLPLDTVAFEIKPKFVSTMITCSYDCEHFSYHSGDSSH